MPVNARAVYVIDGVRTPFLKAKQIPGPFSASDLAVKAGRNLLLRQSLLPTDLDEVVLGNTMAAANEASIARLVALRLGCGPLVTGLTVHRNCGSGMQAIDTARIAIADGRSDLIIAGGCEAMSRAPLLFPSGMNAWLGRFASSKTLSQKLTLIMQFRFSFLSPRIALLQGLTDPFIGLSMGKTAEELAYLFDISRQAMDQFAFLSHQRAVKARKEQCFPYVIPIYDKQGIVYTKDTGVREETSLEKLSQLKPFFDKKDGSVTAGNSSQITDGACVLLLASESAVKRYQLPVIGQLCDAHWAGVEPLHMGLGPVHATIPLLQRHGLQAGDIDYWEINEAFAAQVISCLKAFNDTNYCRNHFGGLAGAFGELNPETVNIDGGAIAMGHPIGASGARVVLQLLHVLQRKKANYGVASLCIGGGQGGAMLIKRTDEVS